LTGPIPFFQHDLGEAELEAVRQVLSGPILTTGATVERVERQLAAYLHAGRSR
jgi:dTDP-4-amino-4,6-dideoxygalactose transaminase